jgi:2-dehydro-3-deoxyphosphogluconate aldolase/(4S)-4-hydroxy-2-oxoglutarate aldolase
LSRFERIRVLEEILRVGLVPLFYEPDPDVALHIALACADGGATAIEFTNRGDHAYPVFVELVRGMEARAPEVMIGAGSIADAPTAALFMGAGAAFVVGPSFDEATARLCNRRKIAYLPGCMTPYEVSRAEEFGVEIVKLFPGQTVGPAFVKALLGPQPWTRLMPTGGVRPTADSIGAWLDAGAVCMGMGSDLIRRSDVTDNAWDAISARVREAISLVADHRAALRGA